ncbi:MAG: DUF3352 domain-containing protein [Actinomycetota bacterium]|nr:DUF3352 domain-containing protein [Actinomycetota bacterium]
MRKIRGVAVMLGTVLLLVALPACGKKTNEAARAAGITPATALGFLSVSLDPSVEQKRNLLSIARRFPDAEAKDDFEASRDELLSSILEEAGLDYEKDVKPWLGSELAIAVLPGSPGPEPRVAVLIEQDDEDKAKAALDKANARAQADGTPPIAYRLVDDFVVATTGDDAAVAQQTLDAFAGQADGDEGDLSASREFSEVVDELHGDRLLLGWIDGKDALAVLSEFVDSSEFPLESMLQQAVPTAFDVHAANSALVMEAVARSTVEAADGKPELTEGLPAGSFGAFTVFDAKKVLGDALRAVVGTGDDPLEEFREQTGLDLERDVLSWMGGESVLVASPAGAGQGFPDMGFVVEPTDRAAAEAALPKIQDALAELRRQSEGMDVAAGLFEDRFVIASTQAFMERLAKDATPSFGESDAYRSVLGESSSDATRTQLVLDVDAIRETLERLLLDDDDDRAQYERDTKPDVEPLDAVGFVLHRDGGFDRAELKVTFD